MQQCVYLPNNDRGCEEVVASRGVKLGTSSFIFFRALGLELGEYTHKRRTIIQFMFRSAVRNDTLKTL